MREKNEQLSTLMNRKDVQYTVAFVVLYILWVLWPVYGVMPFFAFVLLLAYKYMKTRNALTKLTRAAKEQYPTKLTEEKWNMLLSYGFPIYAPKDSYALGQVFRVCELGGYACLVVLAIQQRWPDVMACFSASMFALQMQRTLQPEKYFEKLARKKPDEYGPKAQAIRDLQAWVVSEDAP